MQSLAELAFDLDRCLRKLKTSNTEFAIMLNGRSKVDGFAHAPGYSALSAWRCGRRKIAAHHHKGLGLWLDEMEEEEEGEEEEAEEARRRGGERGGGRRGGEEEEEEGTKGDVAEMFDDEEGEEDEEDEEEGKRTRNTQRKEAAHRCSKLAAGTKQINNTAFRTPP
jgi:hypothetical protein